MVAGATRPMKKWPFQRDAGMAGVSGERFFSVCKKNSVSMEKRDRAGQEELDRYLSTTTRQTECSPGNV